MSEERDRIERGLRELTRRRQIQAPDFDRLVAQPRGTRRGGSPIWRWVAATAVIGAIVAALVLLRPDPINTAPGVSSWEENLVVEWRAATDVFLPDLDQPWLSGPPPLGRSDLTVYTASRSSDFENRPIDEESL